MRYMLHPIAITCAALLAALTGSSTAAEAQAVVVETQRGLPSQKPTFPAGEENVRRPHSFGSFTVGVPMFYDVNLEVVQPGANLRLVGGYDVGFVGFFGELGASWNSIDLRNSGDAELIPLGHSPLTRLYAGLGIRVQYPTERVRPYLDLTLYFNWWNFRETGSACGVFYCTSVNVYHFAPGWGLRPGLQVVVIEPLAVDIGASFAFSYRGTFFAEPRYWLEPFVGVSTRF